MEKRSVSMTREELRERVTEELRQSSEEYCLYCLEYRARSGLVARKTIFPDSLTCTKKISKK
jgi:hypothetical protein